jgi:accessory colonization factor AcfC
MALVQAGKKSATTETQKLYSYLLSKEAREILKKYGFEL